MDASDPELVEVGGDGVRDGGDSRAVGECGGVAVSGQVRGKDAVPGVEPWAQHDEVVVCAADSVQEKQGLAGTGAIPEKSECHR